MLGDKEGGHGEHKKRGRRRVFLCEGRGPWERSGPQGCRSTYSLLCEITFPVCNMKECKEKRTSKRAMAAREIGMRYENFWVRKRWDAGNGGLWLQYGCSKMPN